MELRTRPCWHPQCLVVLRLALGPGMSPPDRTTWGSDCLQPSHLHGILPKVLFGIECHIAEVNSGTRRALCGLSLLLLSLSSHFSALTFLQDELGDRGLQPALLSAVPILWLLMQMGFWRRDDEVWVSLPALLPSAQHQTTPPQGWQCLARLGEAAFDLGAALSPCRIFQALQTSTLPLWLQPPWHRYAFKDSSSQVFLSPLQPTSGRRRSAPGCPPRLPCHGVPSSTSTPHLPGTCSPWGTCHPWWPRR